MRVLKTKFPPPEEADENGILAISSDIDTDMILSAYMNGIFPWPDDERYILWSSPAERGILFLDEFRIPDRTRRYLKKAAFSFRIDSAFEKVINFCAKVPRRGQAGTWITSKLKSAYIELYHEGFAHCFETYDASGTLCGGLYGVRIGNYFSGESMFSTQDNASKYALINTVAYLKHSGLEWMDIQMLTPLLESFGGRLVERSVFLNALKSKIEEPPAQNFLKKSSTL